MKRRSMPVVIFMIVALGPWTAFAELNTQSAIIDKSLAMTSRPPWPKGDQRGMANTLGPGTWYRCGYHLTLPGAKVYEVSHVRSPSAPHSPFGVPLKYTFHPTAGLPLTRHAWNGETISGEPGAQFTQMDALGHFGYLPNSWNGKGDFPASTAHYYGGYTQREVKPTPHSPLLKLGIEHVPPIVTSAVLLDARSYIGKGKALKAGQRVTAGHIKGMIKAQGLEWRGLLPGDVLYIYTGWEDHWKDPDTEKVYYTKGPGLSYDAVKFLGTRSIVLVALDNPFTDPANEGQIYGKGPVPEGTPPDLPFVAHHQNLTQSGIHQIQNAHLEEMAKDKVWTSCTIILPLLEKGAAGSPVRPIAIGAAQ